MFWRHIKTEKKMAVIKKLGEGVIRMPDFKIAYSLNKIKKKKRRTSPGCVALSPAPSTGHLEVLTCLSISRAHCKFTLQFKCRASFTRKCFLVSHLNPLHNLGSFSLGEIAQE
jgi:hypothetical protein